MKVLIVLFVAGLAIWLLFASAGWALKIVVSLVEIISNFVISIISGISNLLGKSSLVVLHQPARDLLELENLLNGIDQEKTELKSYAPKYYKAEPIKQVNYEEELPKIFKRKGLATLYAVNIDDVSNLTQLASTPAYKLIQELKNRPEPICPLLTSIEPPPVEEPIQWHPWTCSKTSYEIDIPRYFGILSPFNYFIKKTFSKAIFTAKSLELRQTSAIEKAEIRNSVLQDLHKLAIEKYELAKISQAIEWSSVKSIEKSIIENYEESYRQEKKLIESLLEKANRFGSDGLITRVEQTLQLLDLPRFVPFEFAIKYDEDSKIFILEHEFPDVGSISWQKIVLLKNGLTNKAANQKESKEAATLLYPSLCLRLACEIVRLDKDDLIEAIAVNGWSNYIEKSTGQQKRAYCASLFASKAQLNNINLVAADPLSAFSALKGVAARSLELTPIAPTLRLNTEDKRFVDAKEILANMSQGENLAAMDWEDFEHLCRELFEKAFAGSGAEVKVTQASRDQGVDAIIFDPDVLRGGKIVVQAKRYTNTVDVSAVRDLYGAIINEGATKGILVTTSHYGPDAYSFAKDKPITLLNGSELLGLLEKYGYKFNINLTEAKRLNAEL